ncbi:CRTAC1 family protein [Terriglobus aquaticus]|uniref:CRTAC1 family protein n=1 Tax=Terriglobus aquaticus TaxID=940139 RepID=A0ABW9KJQ4_9BACT|nr:CRTAC1 family protein [Terriglobus aquaticus]
MDPLSHLFRYSRLALTWFVAVSGCLTAIAQAPPAAPSSKPSFTDVAVQRGVHFKGQAYHTSTKYLMETMGSGVAVFDYDNDGLLDIFFVNGAPIPNPAPKGTVPQKASPADWNRLFHQRKDGTFEDVTERAGLKGVGYGMGVAVGDYDNDGFEDLFVTSYGGNHLYHNNGNGTFTDVTVHSGTGGPTTPGQTWSTSAMWVDLDNDGRLDLLVLRYVTWDFEDVWCGEHREGYRSYCHPDIFPVIRPLAYHNNGDGTFKEVGGDIGLKPGKGLGLALADFDGDGKVDFAVANDSMLEFLYRNKGDGTFEETGLNAEIAVDSDGKTYAGMGIDFQDYDNDGLPDLVITNLANQKYALYRNNGDGSFTYDTYVSGLARMTLLHSGWGIHFFDYDNDGLKDLLITQGHDLDTVQLNFPQLHYKEPMLLARNEGSGKFVDVSREAGPAFQEPWVGRGMAIGDLDNDGRLDAVVSTNDGPAHILHNETASTNHWITLLLVGHRSNRDAIGAQVKVTTAKASQFFTVSTAGSYLSASDKRLHFGLGSEQTIQRIHIRWPSGIEQDLTNVATDRQLTIDEPTSTKSPAKP